MAGASAWRQKPQAVSTLDLKWRDTYGECGGIGRHTGLWFRRRGIEGSSPFTYPRTWKNGREAYGAILERWWRETFRGFESHFFLHMRVSPSGRWRESPKLVCVSTTWVRIPTTRAIICSLRRKISLRAMWRCEWLPALTRWADF